MDEQLVITHDVNDGGGRYWAEVPGGEAELTYVKRGDKVIIIDHTYVPGPARGGKVAQLLVERAAVDARTQKLRIVPQCPYVEKLFQRRPELNELRAE